MYLFINKMVHILCLLCVVFLKIIVKTKANIILDGGVNLEEQKEIIDIHNKLRLKIMSGEIPNQPQATDMKKLCWDKHLAIEAQRIAHTMKYKHEFIKDDRWVYVGQNLAENGSNVFNSPKDWKWVINQWFNEFKDYVYNSQITNKTGHYTQVVWANTTHVGCGYIHFIDNKVLLKFRKLWVCNYGPGGNIDGMPPYTTGNCKCSQLHESQACD